MTDTRKETREDMQRQAKRGKMANILRKMHYTDIQGALDNLVGKYGVDVAYKLIQSAALEPFEVAKKVKSPIKTSRAALDYMLKHNLSDEVVADIVKTDIKNVQTSRRYRVTNIHPNAVARERQRKMENKINAHNAKKQKSSPSKTEQKDNPNLPPYIQKPKDPLLKSGEDWNDYMKSHTPAWKPLPLKKKTVSELAHEEYTKATGGDKDKSLNIEELMGTGVTAEDIQSVIKEDPNMVHRLKPGITNSKLENAAKRKGNETTGNCLSGIQQMYDNAFGETREFWAPDPKPDKNNPNKGKWWEGIKKLPGQNANSACNTHRALANSGLFIPVTICNKAFNNPGKNKEMNDFIDRCAVGTIINCDNVETKGYAGKSGSKDGHVFVIENANGKKQCDFEQWEIPYSNYGQYIHISLATDMSVPEDFAEKCLAAKLAREQKEAQQIARKKSRTQGR